MQGVFERLGSLAVLRATGFTMARIRRLILLETLFMVGSGLLLGASIGCLALLPLLVAGRATLPWIWLAVSAVPTFVSAVGAGLVAARGGVIPVRPAAEPAPGKVEQGVRPRTGPTPGDA